MPDRLAELRRQRALIADHLAWLDREIAASNGIKPLLSPDAPLAKPLSTDPAAILAKAAEPKPDFAPPVADDSHVHQMPEHQPSEIKNDVRRGCFLYFALATVAVTIGTGLLIWASRSTWFHEEISPYLAKVFFVALVLILGAGIRGLVAKFRQ